MDSLNQIAQDILSIVRAKRVDDYDVTAAQVKRWINYKRAVFIKNEINKKKPLDEDYVQSLGCVKLEMVPDSDCGEGCLVLRTCQRIPTPITTKLGLAITRVGPVELSARPFPFRTYHQSLFSGNGRFNQTVFAFYLDGYIYIRTTKAHPLTKALRLINIRGVFENPEEVSSFKECDGSPCYDLNAPYPIKKWMVDGIINSILEERFAIVEEAKRDVLNDEDNLA